MMWFGFCLFLVTIVSGLIYLAKQYKLPKQSAELVRKILFPKGRPIVLGHRGGQFEAPENTLLAIATAHQNGATAVEIDVDFTKDGVAILHHDDTVDRLTDGTGFIKDILFRDITKLNAASKFNYVITERGGRKKLEFEGIPTLMAALRLCMELKLSVNLDVKSNAGAMTRFLQQFLMEHERSPDFIIVTSFNPYIVYTIRDKCPEFATGLIWRPHYFSRESCGEPRYNALVTLFLDAYDYLYMKSLDTWLVDFLGVSMLSLKRDYLLSDKRNIEKLRERGFEVMAWTVNNAQEKEYFLSKNVPVITDSVLNNSDCPESN